MNNKDNKTNEKATYFDNMQVLIEKYIEILDFEKINNDIYYNEFEWKKEYNNLHFNKNKILLAANAKRVKWEFNKTNSISRINGLIKKFLLIKGFLPLNYINLPYKPHKKIGEFSEDIYETKVITISNKNLSEMSYAIRLNNKILHIKSYETKEKYEKWTPFQLTKWTIEDRERSKEAKEAVEHFISIFAKTPKERKHFLMLFSLGLSNYNNGVMTIIYGKSNCGKTQWFNWFSSLLNDNQIGFATPDAFSKKDGAAFRGVENTMSIRMDDIPHQIDKNNETIFKTILTSSESASTLDFKKLYSNRVKRLNCGSFFATANKPLYLDYRSQEFRKRVKHFHAYIDPTHPNYKKKYDGNALSRPMNKDEQIYLLWELLQHFRFNFKPEYYNKGSKPMWSNVDNNIIKKYDGDDAIVSFWKEYGEELHLMLRDDVWDKFKLYISDFYPPLVNKISWNTFKEDSLKIKGVEYKKNESKKIKSLNGENIYKKMVWFYNILKPNEDLLVKKNDPLQDKSIPWTKEVDYDKIEW